nr:Chain B, mdm2 peptide [synthetic construct]
EKPSSS